ncbi:DUF3006 domain-containing protein [Desulfosporosinus meridiei]|uniref:DUF3006 domain-containing protein n=1 Tax=Desulfosporosinus meridiei (strain ATCC BAA-275 / DSM 13257 / KCTC 12902 / NCIMB 13706 / S10) TaxID=768704 RepID=J7IWY3_DESMD|nr:DUF3006 domain-containing protein [Desulfosporosinus meridiei]AFQ46240.1 Protein of unknown function (DUF3006) [Desulfosporosinus meridiei DSM 13257]
MIVVVDRFEGKFAVIEFPDRTTKDVPLDNLPSSLKPGDCLLFDDGKYSVAPEETEKRKAIIRDMMKSMWSDK